MSVFFIRKSLFNGICQHNLTKAGNKARKLQAANKRIKELEKKNRELEELNEFLEEASAFFAANRRKSGKKNG